MFLRAIIPNAGPKLLVMPVFQYACQGAMSFDGAWLVHTMTCRPHLHRNSYGISCFHAIVPAKLPSLGRYSYVTNLTTQ